MSWLELASYWHEIQTSASGGTGTSSPGQVLVNIAGSVAGDAGLTYDPTTDTLTTPTVAVRNVTATALATPAITAPLTVNGTPGATTYGYKAVAFLNDGTSSAASPEVTIATGPATLNGTDNITVAWPAVTGAATYKLYRTTGGAAPPKLIYSGTAFTFDDIGAAGTAETPATVNTTGTVTAPTVAAPVGSALSAYTSLPAATTGASQAGPAINFTAASAVASTDTDGAAAGGSISFTTGSAARRTSGVAVGGDINFTTGVGIGGGAPGKVTLTGATSLYLTSGVITLGNGVILGTAGFGLPAAGYLQWSSTAAYTGAADLILSRDAANTLAQKGTANLPQFQRLYSSNGGYREIGSTTELLTIAAAATTDSTADLLPAGAVIRAITYRVTTAIPTAATFTIGDATTAARFATGASTAANATGVGLIHVDQTGAAGPIQASAAKIRITPNATPGAATGVVRLTVYYETWVPPTS